MEKQKYTLAFLSNTDNLKQIPNSIKKSVYDQDDNVLFGDRYVKGKVTYNYIPAELMETGRPYFVGTGIAYDGIGNKDLPADATILSFDKIVAMFPDNQ